MAIVPYSDLFFFCSRMPIPRYKKKVLEPGEWILAYGSESALQVNDQVAVPSEAPRFFNNGARRGENVVEKCEGMIELSAALFGVSVRELLSPRRSSVSVSRVRQIAMYVTHVALQLNMTEIGRGFCRDRTTVMHACHLIEDMRDDPDFDRLVALVERTAIAAFAKPGGACDGR